MGKSIGTLLVLINTNKRLLVTIFNIKQKRHKSFYYFVQALIANATWGSTVNCKIWSIDGDPVKCLGEGNLITIKYLFQQKPQYNFMNDLKFFYKNIMNNNLKVVIFVLKYKNILRKLSLSIFTYKFGVPV